jgi:hypothetical protein
VSVLVWLLIPLLVGSAASVWAWSTGRRTPIPADRDRWEELDRHRRLRLALSADERGKTA